MLHITLVTHKRYLLAANIAHCNKTEKPMTNNINSVKEQKCVFKNTVLPYLLSMFGMKAVWIIITFFFPSKLFVSRGSSLFSKLLLWPLKRSIFLNRLLVSKTPRCNSGVDKRALAWTERQANCSICDFAPRIHMHPSKVRCYLWKSKSKS